MIHKQPLAFIATCFCRTLPVQSVLIAGGMLTARLVPNSII